MSYIPYTVDRCRERIETIIEGDASERKHLCTNVASDICGHECILGEFPVGCPYRGIVKTNGFRYVSKYREPH